MYVLGISCYYHDASAALLKDGEIVAAAEEERFTRIKHDTSFPKNAINFCLESQGITINDIGYIGFYEKPFLKFERLLYQVIDTFPRSWKVFIKAMPSWITEKLRVMKAVRKMKYRGDVFFIEHHLAHAASCFLVSPFRKAAIVTVDGVGEWTTTAYGIGRENKIELWKHIKFPHSLGLLYSTITAYLGFSVNNSEYKVMGLAAYGDPEKYYDKLRKVIDINKDGSFRMDMSYFSYHYSDRMPSKKLFKLLGGKPGKGELTQRHKDIAAALQKIYEEAFFKIVRHARKETKCSNLVLSGGCALNSVANGKLKGRVWIQPNASDGGTAMGAAAYIYFTILGNKRNYVLEHAYLGPEYKRKQIKKFLEKNNVKYSILNRKALIKKTAKLIHENNIVAWFQGRMEWGPRALGNRSILANPCNPDARDLLNAKVKHREMFRPFAPVVCKDDAKKFFDYNGEKATDFMLMVRKIKPGWRIPSVTHIDGTGRFQTVDKGKLYDLIKEFGRISGVPALINTSFNVSGEPIVCTPYDAYKCMRSTKIDYLVIDNFLIKNEK